MRLRGFVVLTAALSLGGCFSGRRPPEPGESRGAVPDLTGRTVMVLPVQAVEGLTGDADAELGFALESRMTGVRWVLPPALRRAIAGSPSLDAPLEGLPVGMFLRAEVERIGDPLFGVLVRLGALTGAQVALIPVVVRYGAPVAGAEAGAAEVAAAIVDVRNGFVLWFGIEAGAPGGPSDPGVMASALDQLSRRLAIRSGR